MIKSQGVTSIEYRNAIGHFITGVTVITARIDGENYGLTASAVSSVSLEPPMLLVCVNQSSGTCRAISESKELAVNVLDIDQGKVAKQFATPDSDKFKNIDIIDGFLNLPLLKNNLVALECKVVDEITAGTHSIFIAKVKRTYTNSSSKSPLAYYKGKFFSL